MLNRSFQRKMLLCSCPLPSLFKLLVTPNMDIQSVIRRSLPHMSSLWSKAGQGHIKVMSLGRGSDIILSTHFKAKQKTRQTQDGRLFIMDAKKTILSKIINQTIIHHWTRVCGTSFDCHVSVNIVAKCAIQCNITHPRFLPNIISDSAFISEGSPCWTHQTPSPQIPTSAHCSPPVRTGHSLRNFQ